jgi:hypothetical protein
MCCGDEVEDKMSFSEAPVKTEAQQILLGLDELNKRFDRQAEGLNNIGANLTWLVQNTQGLFAMFQSPAFLQQISSLMGGMTNGGQPESDGPDDSDD